VDDSSICLIEIRIRDLAQLFNSMDPAPFHHKDLDPDAEDFIVSWAREYPRDSELRIVIHLGKKPAEEDPADLARQAINNYFAYRAEHAQREFRQLMQRGRTSLAIGLGFLAACLLAGDAVGKFGGGTLITIIKESLIIGGWVAMWRPLEIFLYSWWPLRRERRIYEKLARAEVHVLQAAS